MIAEREKQIREACFHQGKWCQKLGSDFTAHLCSLLGENLKRNSKIGELVFGWHGSVGSEASSLPLRLCGSLNRLALSGESQLLADKFPPGNTALHQIDWLLISEVIKSHEDSLLIYMQSAPQTNEFRRSAPLLAALHLVAERFGMPINLYEIGASAGLNLLPDLYCLQANKFTRGSVGSEVLLQPQWSGDIPPNSALTIRQRRGCDLAPVYLGEAAARTRLLSYIWPDQTERVERTKNAMELALAQLPQPVEMSDGVSWLRKQLGEGADGQVDFFFHTVAWQYLDQADQQTGNELFAKCGALRTSKRPLIRFSMEGAKGVDGALLEMTCWPDGETVKLGCADFHGRWVDWQGTPQWC